MREQGTSAWNLGSGTGEGDREDWHWEAGSWGCASEIPCNLREAQNAVKSSMHSWKPVVMSEMTCTVSLNLGVF